MEYNKLDIKDILTQGAGIYNSKLYISFYPFFSRIAHRRTLIAYRTSK